MTANRGRNLLMVDLVKHALESITDEMALTMVRTARSAVLKEAMDFSTALFSVLAMSPAAFRGVNARRSSAAATGRPWISRVTSRHLNAEMRAPR